MNKIILTTVLFIATINAGNMNLSGTVISDNKKMITSRYMGFIKSMNVGEGDSVEKGQMLYEIDTKEIDSAKSQVELSLSSASLVLQMNSSQYNNALLNLTRYKRLYKKKMVSKFEVETLDLAVKNLKDMVEIARVGVKQVIEKKKEILNQYNYLKIKAPSKGVVVEKKLSEGEMSIPGMPALILTDLSKLKIIVSVGESNLKFVDIGKDVSIEIPSMGFKTVGKIQSIIPSSNYVTRKFKIKIAFDNKGKKIYPGMYAKVIISQE